MNVHVRQHRSLEDLPKVGPAVRQKRKPTAPNKVWEPQHHEKTRNAPGQLRIERVTVMERRRRAQEVGLNLYPYTRGGLVIPLMVQIQIY